MVGDPLRDLGRKRRVGGGLQVAAQRGLQVGGDGACATGWRPWGQIAGQALLSEPAGDAALRDLKHLDQLATGQTTRVGSEDALAQIG